MRGRQILPTKQQRLLSSYPLQSAEKVRTLSGKHTYFYFLQRRALTTLLLFSGGPVPRDPGGHPGHNSGRVVERQEERGPRPHVHGGGRRQQHSGRGASREKGGDWANCFSVSVLTRLYTQATPNVLNKAATVGSTTASSSSSPAAAAVPGMSESDIKVGIETKIKFFI